MTDRIVPAEWDLHRCLYTAWPSHPDLWQEDLEPARAEVGAMIRALAEPVAGAPGDSVVVLACGEAACQSAQSSVGDVAQVVQAEFGDIWLRDTGPIFVRQQGQVVALRFDTNGWGGKYQLPHDDTVGDAVALFSGAPVQRQPFILEGGGLEHDGTGTVITTRQCLLNPNRNPGWDEAAAERHLQAAFNCRRIVWLQDGLLNDHTDGHVDNLARFVAPGTVVCQEAADDADPNTERYEAIAADLTAAGFRVVRIPAPGAVYSEDGDLMPASHMNFIIGNHTVVVPTYGTPSADAAVAALAPLFPGRRVLGRTANALLTGGGAFHCITQQEPLP